MKKQILILLVSLFLLSSCQILKPSRTKTQRRVHKEMASKQCKHKTVKAYKRTYHSKW